MNQGWINSYSQELRLAGGGGGAKAYAAAALTYLVYVVSEEEAVAGAKTITMVAMHGVMRELIRERRKNPQDDLLSALAVARAHVLAVEATRPRAGAGQ